VISIVFAIMFYVATFLLIVGLGMKIWRYATTPAPLKVPIMPAPLTRTGVGFRLFREAAFFESLFKSNKWIWLFGYMFHVALLLVLLRHIRYFTIDVWWWVEIVQPFGVYAGFAMVIGLTGLLARRFLVERIRYISSPSDYLMLVLLLGIAGSGLLMKFVSHTDIIAVKSYMLGLMRFQIGDLPTHPILLTHLASVALLMAIFPISKLLHGVGIFFSPSRNQVDNARQKRHIAPWAKKLEEGEDR
jgi:nitrate reductase gamma subunit